MQFAMSFISFIFIMFGEFGSDFTCIFLVNSGD